MQKVYVSEEEKEKFMEKLNRDVEVSELLLHRPATGGRYCTSCGRRWLRRFLKQELMQGNVSPFLTPCISLFKLQPQFSYFIIKENGFLWLFDCLVL